MMYYVQLSGHHYVTKNKLEAAIKEKIREYDGIVVANEFTRGAIESKISEMLKATSAEHPKCTPISFSSFNAGFTSQPERRTLNSGNVFTLTFLPVKEIVSENPYMADHA